MFKPGRIDTAFRINIFSTGPDQVLGPGSSNSTINLGKSKKNPDYFSLYMDPDLLVPE